MCDTAGTHPPAPAPTLKPCFAELLLKRVAPPTLVVRVEHILPTAPISRPNPGDNPPSDTDIRSRCLRLAVSDDHLQIQAVVTSEAHPEELAGLQQGDLIEVKKYQLDTAPRLDGNGRVVFLWIEKCAWVSRESHLHPQVDGGGGFLEESVGMAPSVLQEAERRPPQLNRAVSDLGGPHKRAQEDEHDAGGGAKKKRRKKKKKGQMDQQSATSLAHPLGQHRRVSPSSEDSDDESFETMPVTNSQAEKRRQVLRQIQQNITETLPTRSRLEAERRIEDAPSITAEAPTPTPPPIDLEERDDQTRHSGGAIEHIEQSTSAILSGSKILASTTDTDTGTKITPPTVTTATTTTSYEQQAQSEPKPTPSSLCTAPIHNLSSLLSPSTSIPRRNYACTVLAVISWISPSTIHRPNTPFPPKRHIKIHDPSISHRYSGVTLAVFVDARAFLPKVGTIALFRGVVMQRWQGEVILNKYASNVGAAAGAGEEEEEDWFVSDEQVLLGMGFDVPGMRLWWEKRGTKQE